MLKFQNNRKDMFSTATYDNRVPSMILSKTND